MNQECRDVSDVRHGFYISSRTDHEKLAGRYLVEEVIDIAAIAFTEYNRGTHDDQRTRRIFGGPGPVNTLRLKLRFTVSVEWIEWTVLVDRNRLKSIDGDAAGENDPAHTGIAGCMADLLGAAHIYLVVAGERAHIVTVFGGEIDNGIGTLQKRGDRLVSGDVAFGPEFGKLLTAAKVADANTYTPLHQGRHQPATDKSGTSENYNARLITGCLTLHVSSIA
jgi:hypothetical protein